MQIDILGIQAFLAITECGSFALAAQRLNLSQTAISHRMRKLEESLGVPLMVRTARGIALTEAGNTLLPQARAAVQQLEASCETVRNHGLQAARWLAFACLPTIAASIAVPLLQSHGARHDGAPRLRLFDSSPGEILELVTSGAVPFGITVMRTLPAQLEAAWIADEPFVLVVPAAHPLAGRASVAWQDIAGQPLIRISLPSGNSMTIDDAIGPLREVVDWRWEAQRNATALDMVRAGLGLTVVPRLSVEPAHGLAVVALQAPAVQRQLVAVTRRGEALDSLARELCDAAIALLRERLHQ